MHSDRHCQRTVLGLRLPACQDSRLSNGRGFSRSEHLLNVLGLANTSVLSIASCHTYQTACVNAHATMETFRELTRSLSTRPRRLTFQTASPDNCWRDCHTSICSTAVATQAGAVQLFVQVQHSSVGLRTYYPALCGLAEDRQTPCDAVAGMGAATSDRGPHCLCCSI